MALVVILPSSAIAIEADRASIIAARNGFIIGTSPYWNELELTGTRRKGSKEMEPSQAASVSTAGASRSFHR